MTQRLNRIHVRSPQRWVKAEYHAYAKGYKKRNGDRPWRYPWLEIHKRRWDRSHRDGEELQGQFPHHLDRE